MSNQVEVIQETKESAPEIKGQYSEEGSENQTEATKNPLAEQFQRIAKQEKYVSSERAKLEAAKKSLESDKLAIDAYNSLKGRNPFEILEHFGVTYDKLLEADKDRQNPVDPKIREALQKVQELESKMTQKERDVEQAQLARAEIQLKADIDSIVSSKEYDLIEKLGAKDAIVEYMEEMWDTEGVVPTIEEACDAITSHLVEKVNSIKESKWLKPKETLTEENVDKEPLKTTKLPSISNKMTQSTEFSKKPMSDAERLQAATAIFASSHKGK